MRKTVPIADGWDDKKARVTLALNRMLKDVGVNFSVEPLKGTHRQLVITIDEDKLNKATKKSSGRPAKHDFDYEKAFELKEQGLVNTQIAKELNISISLYYLRMREVKKIMTKEYLIEQYKLAILDFRTAHNEEEQWNARKQMARFERIAFELYGNDLDEAFESMKSEIPSVMLLRKL